MFYKNKVQMNVIQIKEDFIKTPITFRSEPKRSKKGKRILYVLHFINEFKSLVSYKAQQHLNLF